MMELNIPLNSETWYTKIFDPELFFLPFHTVRGKKVAELDAAEQLK